VTDEPEDTGRRRYFDLQSLARRQGRNTQELLTLYALEGLLARLAHTEHARTLVLKGGMLLAAFDQRRPTGDLDMHAGQLAGDVDTIRQVVVDIAEVALDDGLAFDAGSATAQPIREDDEYQGVRVSVEGALHTAKLSPKVDVNVGDPVWPAPQLIELPRLLGGAPLRLRGYPLHMVLAEKLVTAVHRGTGSTRWRDFADVYLLTGAHQVQAGDLHTAIRLVADHRVVELGPLVHALSGFGDVAQAKWEAWRRKQELTGRLPAAFDDVVREVIEFADPLLTGNLSVGRWDPTRRRWVR
jgi:hypothetical protein